MNETIEKILSENPTHYFATVGLDGKPKVRPFGFMMVEEGRLYYCTNNKKDVYAQMQRQPYVELCVCTPKFEWLRVSGKAVFSDDSAIKAKVLECSEMVKSMYKSADNPIFEVFYLDEAKAVLSDFSGEPPKEFTL
jgi:uncharacterized pyridoxamine 5'-phosphate oxidase family protein